MRVRVSRTNISQLVASQLESLVAARSSFTAFTVTTALRSEHPNLDIAHGRVRLIVHNLMLGVIRSGQYEACFWSFGDSPAVFYMPASPVFVADSNLLLFSPN